MVYNCIVISDDIQEMETLKNHIEIHAQLNLEGSFKSIYSVPANTYSHIAFINIDQSVMTGQDQVKLMRSNLEFLIFTGHAHEYARIAYDLDGLDYLSKPIDLPRFNRAINKVLRYKNVEAQPRVTIDSSFAIKDADDENSWVIISYREVLAVESDKNYLKIFTTAKCHVTHLAISKFEFSVINLPTFMRVHRSFIVSTDHVRKTTRNVIHMKNSDIKIPIGGNYRKKLQGFLDDISLNK
jgi:two-component system LytT family response regulator